MTGFYEGIQATANDLINRYGTQGRAVQFDGDQEIAGEPFPYVAGLVETDTVPTTITRQVDVVIFVPRVDAQSTPLPVDGYVRLASGDLYVIVGRDTIQPAELAIMDRYWLAS